MAGAFDTWLPVGYSPEKNGPDRYINEGRAWRAQLLREILINRSSIHFAPPDGSPRRCSFAIAWQMIFHASLAGPILLTASRQVRWAKRLVWQLRLLTGEDSERSYAVKA